jgi:hypothetical protein
MSDNQLEELHEVSGLGGVGGTNVLPELLNVVGVRVKLNSIQDFVQAAAEDGIVDIVVVVIDELVGQEGHKAAKFVQT